MEAPVAASMGGIALHDIHTYLQPLLGYDVVKQLSSRTELNGQGEEVLAWKIVFKLYNI